VTCGNAYQPSSTARSFCAFGRNLSRPSAGFLYVRLSPKSIFFGLVALGLPVAVTIGWQLATPATRSAAVDSPGGAGGMGDAPARHAKPASASVASSPAAPVPSVMPSVLSSAAVSTPVGPAVSGLVTTTSTALPTAPPTEASQDPLPPLTEPPVPTPTEPDAPTPTASASTSPSPADSSDSDRRFQWAGH
jgi:hypothetical protein